MEILDDKLEVTVDSFSSGGLGAKISQKLECQKRIPYLNGRITGNKVVVYRVSHITKTSYVILFSSMFGIFGTVRNALMMKEETSTPL